MAFQILDKNGNLKETIGILPAASFPALTGAVTTSAGSLVTTIILTEFSVTTTGNIDDLDFSNANTIRMNNASLATIRGLKAGVAGQQVTIVSVGAGEVDLAHQNTGSVAANRLLLPVTSANMPMAAGVGSSIFEYDVTTGRWRLVFFTQGAAITPAFSAANFVASSGTWTVAAGNVNSFKYTLLPSGLLIVAYDLRSTSITGGTAGYLEINLPGGFHTLVTSSTALFGIDNGTNIATLVQGGLGAAFTYSLTNYRIDVAAWALSTSNTGLRGTIFVPVS